MPSIFSKISAFLCESTRLELLSKQFGVPVEEIERLYLPADPTKGKYLTWILRQVKAGQLRFPEDQAKVSDRLGQFAQLARKPQFQGKKDLNQYKTFGELARAVEDNAGVQTKGEVIRQKGAELIKEWNGGIVVKDDDEEVWVRGKVEVYAITTFEALDAMGAQQTEWCVKDRRYFDSYAAEGLPYYLATLNGKPAQLLHIPSRQCMDKWDEECGIEVFEQAGIDCWEILTFDEILNAVAREIKLDQRKQENGLDMWVGRITKAISGEDPAWGVANFCVEFNSSYSRLVVLMQGLKRAGRIAPISKALLERIISDGGMRRINSNQLAFSWSSQVLDERWAEYEEAVNWELEQGHSTTFSAFIMVVAEYAAAWRFVWPQLEEAILDQMRRFDDTNHISAASAAAYYWANTHDGPWPEMEKLWKGNQPGFNYNFSTNMALYNQHVGYEFFRGMKVFKIPQ